MKNKFSIAFLSDNAKNNKFSDSQIITIIILIGFLTIIQIIYQYTAHRLKCGVVFKRGL